MKQTHNRQNKLFQTQLPSSMSTRVRFSTASYSTDLRPEEQPKAGAVFGVIKELLLATKIAQAAKFRNLDMHNFDTAARLAEFAKQKKPLLIFLDWDKCEAESFKVLKELKQNADLKGVPSIGFVSSEKMAIKSEAQRAGCTRVYGRTEFGRELNDILVRFTS